MTRTFADMTYDVPFRNRRSIWNRRRCLSINGCVSACR